MMKTLLLDTHVWLWTLTTPQRLPDNLRSRLCQESQEVVFSAASSWELTIKYALGKMDLPEPPRTFIGPRLIRDGIRCLPIDLAHTIEVGDLPPIHADPFDRLLVAQARVEDFTLVTKDAIVEKYDADIWRI